MVKSLDAALNIFSSVDPKDVRGTNKKKKKKKKNERLLLHT